MKISHLIESLKTVVERFPDAECELGHCSCCIYILIDNKRIAVLNVEEDRFEYIRQAPLLPPEVVKKLVKGTSLEDRV